MHNLAILTAETFSWLETQIDLQSVTEKSEREGKEGETKGEKGRRIKLVEAEPHETIDHLRHTRCEPQLPQTLPALAVTLLKTRVPGILGLPAQNVIVAKAHLRSRPSPG